MDAPWTDFSMPRIACANTNAVKTTATAILARVVSRNGIGGVWFQSHGVPVACDALIDSSSACCVPDFPELKVFSQSSAENLKEFLGLPSLRQALGKLHLKESESLHIYRNGPVLYSQPDSSEEILQAVEALCDLVEKLPPLGDTVEMDTLPQIFKKLFPLIRAWAI